MDQVMEERAFEDAAHPTIVRQTDLAIEIGGS